jgi:hypothetical protein
MYVIVTVIHGSLFLSKVASFLSFHDHEGDLNWFGTINALQ